MSAPILICLCLFACFGCAHDDSQLPVYPVRGRVLVNGQPAAGARVVFYSTKDEPPDPAVREPTPAATTDANGEFRLDSYGVEDGAPAGEFKVTIVWPQPPPPNFDGVYEAKDQLRGRYANPRTTTLTARVEPGGGEIPAFELR